MLRLASLGIAGVVCTAGCADPPRPLVTMRLVDSAPSLDTPIAQATAIHIVFDYDITPEGLRYGGVLNGSVAFFAYGEVVWSDGSTSTKSAVGDTPELQLGSETSGTSLGYDYPASELQLTMDLVANPPSGVTVRSVELMGRLEFRFGCEATRQPGTPECPTNLGGDSEPLSRVIISM